jgi:hypothetical protein
MRGLGQAPERGVDFRRFSAIKSKPRRAPKGFFAAIVDAMLSVSNWRYGSSKRIKTA